MYSGMSLHLMKLLSSLALMVLTYEVFRGWLDGFTVINNKNATTLMAKKGGGSDAI
jgi:hypothetical protein